MHSGVPPHWGSDSVKFVLAIVFFSDTRIWDGSRGVGRRVPHLLNSGACQRVLRHRQILLGHAPRYLLHSVMFQVAALQWSNIFDVYRYSYVCMSIAVL